MSKRWSDFEPEEKDLLKQLSVPAEEGERRDLNCPPPEMLLGAQSGVLPEKQMGVVLRHLEGCGVCRALVRGLAHQELSSLTPDEELRIRERVWREIGEAPAPEKKYREGAWRWFWRPVPVVALATVAALVLLWVYVPRQAPPSSPMPAAVSQPPAPPVFAAFRLEKLAVKLPVGSVLTWRDGGTSKADPLIADMFHALEPYRRDDFAEAARRLEKLARKYPRAAEPRLYLGVCQLFLGRNADAVQSLKAARRAARGVAEVDSTWYLSLAYYRTGKTGQVRAELGKLCSSKSELASRACAALQELPATTK